MKEVYGDLITMAENGEFDVIVHGCNCFCNMGAGIAKTIKAKFGEAWFADRQSTFGDRSKLGSYTSAEIFRGHAVFSVINAYTQYSPGVGVDQCDYDGIRDVFRLIKRDFPGKRIGYPLIGAGLAGGDWERISAIINDALENEDHTLVRFTG